MYSLLYVDDEPVLLELGKIFLERSKEFTVITKTSADEGLDLLKSVSFDAIISDYAMPGKDGIEFLKTVRALYGDIPFILFTGKGREDVVIDAINSGANFYLQKGGQPKAQFAELAHKIKSAVELKRAEQSFKESEQLHAGIINFLPDALFAIDTSGTVTAWNRTMEDLTGVKREDIIDKGNYEYSIPFYGERRPVLIDLVLTGDEKIQKNYPFIERKNDTLISELYIPHLFRGRGAYLWFTASPLYDTRGNVTGAIEAIRDISDRKKIETSLSESEQRYRAVVEGQSEFICRFNPDGTHTFINDAYCRYFHKKREEIINNKFIPLIPVEDRAAIRKHFESLNQGNPTATIIHRIIMDSGEVRWQRWSDRAIFDDQGKIIEYQSVGYDITSRKRAEEELQAAYSQLSATEKELKIKFEELQKSQEIISESEKIYRTIFENTGTAMLIIEEDNTISLINSRCELLTGYLKDEIEGKRKWAEFVYPEDLPRMLSYNKERWKNGADVPSHYEFRFLAKDSTLKIVFMSIGIIPGTKKAIVSLVNKTENGSRDAVLRKAEGG